MEQKRPTLTPSPKAYLARQGSVKEHYIFRPLPKIAEHRSLDLRRYHSNQRFEANAAAATGGLPEVEYNKQ